MGSFNECSSSILEELVNEYVGVSGASVVRFKSGPSRIPECEDVLALTLTDESTLRSTATAVIQKLYTDLKYNLASRQGHDTLGLPRTWILFENVAGDSVSTVDSEAVKSILASRTFAASIEEQIMAIMAEVLQLSPKKVRHATSFTSVGGTARTAIEVQTQCAQKGIMLSLADILSGNDLETVTKSSFQLLKYGGAQSTEPGSGDAHQATHLACPMESWGITETQRKETISDKITLELSEKLAALGTEPFPLRKTLALLLHAALVSFRRLRPDRESIAVVVKNYYTGAHKSLSVNLHKLGELIADVRYFESLLQAAELRPGATFCGTAELIVQYEEGNLCDRDNEPQEPEDATAYLPSVFVINVHKENTSLCLQLQSPKCLDTDSLSAKWLGSCENLIKGLVVEPDAQVASKYWEEQLRDLAPATFPSRAASYERAETSITTIPVPGQVGGADGIHSIIQAAWAITLGRYNDSSDVFYDTSVARKQNIFDHEEGVSQVLPMRVAFDGTICKPLPKRVPSILQAVMWMLEPRLTL
ncbi:hypothetical protein NLG97_g5473 [Lecanicillium saksenae]|uniref:Uncharacterized protein n=1 Tax=Lecanicillium saksenae TaxID=468837 RepID=A0ACC1QTP3_9HYPO|nr:hypothetical protein NLG97_g5473 [Lecanicillium saksenae]